MSVRGHFIAYLQIALAMAIVGSSVVVGKLVVMHVPVFLVSGLRFFIATLILLPLWIYTEQGFPRLEKKDFLLLTMQSMAGVFFFNICMLYGLTLTTAIEGGIITSTLPAVVGMMALLMLKERISLKQGVGIALAIFGTLAMNVAGEVSGGDRGNHPLLGNLLVFGAVIGEALFICAWEIVIWADFSPWDFRYGQSVGFADVFAIFHL